MNIEVIKMFKVPFEGVMQFKKLDAVAVTALSIWLVEAIHNPNVAPLVFKETPFIWRVNPEQGDPYLSIEGLQNGIDLKYARELVEAIEKLGDNDHLLDDTYPCWYEHKAEQGDDETGYRVTMFTGRLLGYVSMARKKVPVLPIALQVHGDNEYYTIVKGRKKEGEIFYTFG